MHSPSRNHPDIGDALLRKRAPLISIPALTLPGSAQLERMLWGLALLLWLAYAAFFMQLTSFPFQDYPNHLARAAILADLIFHGGQRFGDLFSAHFALAPYILHDAVLTSLVALLGVVAGGAVFMALVLVSLPCALYYYMRVNNLAPRARLLVAIISVYLATDWFFLMGFMAFRLALAAIIVSLALTDALRRDWSRRTYAGYVVLLVLGYLTHLTSLVFFAPVLAITGVVRLWFARTTLRREILLWLPVLALMVAHFGLIAVPHDAAHPAPYNYYWGTVPEKIRRLNWEFERFDGRPAPLMTYTLVICVLGAIWRYLHWRALLRPQVLEHLAIAAAFFAIYWILPSAYEKSTFVDVRALCMVTLFLLLAALHVPSREEANTGFGTRWVVGLALALACVNLAYLVLHMQKNDVWLRRYRQVIAAIPPKTNVLPIYTQPMQMDIAPFLHAASYVTLDRGANMPYLFSGDRGDLMTYFNYKHRPYYPDEYWYKSLEYWNSLPEASYEVSGRRYTWRFHYSRPDRQWKMAELVPVDWNRIACAYDYLLVMVPFREPYLEVPVTVVTYNETAALLAVDKHACHPGVSTPQRVRLPTEH